MSWQPSSLTGHLYLLFPLLRHTGLPGSWSQFESWTNCHLFQEPPSDHLIYNGQAASPTPNHAAPFRLLRGARRSPNYFFLFSFCFLNPFSHSDVNSRRAGILSVWFIDVPVIPGSEQALRDQPSTHTHTRTHIHTELQLPTSSEHYVAGMRLAK